MSEDPLGQPIGRQRGQMLFALLLVVLAAFLVLSFPSQVTSAEDEGLFSQPGFWPGVGAFGMLVFAGLHMLRLPRRKPRAAELAEGRVWLRAIEYVLWFLAYVLLVPLIGYLPMTVAFLVGLTWRLGYRRPKMLWLAGALGVGIVVLFKSFLSVKIPGAMLYDLLPGAVRSFFILNF